MKIFKCMIFSCPNNNKNRDNGCELYKNVLQCIKQSRNRNIQEITIKGGLDEN